MDVIVQPVYVEKRERRVAKGGSVREPKYRAPNFENERDRCLRTRYLFRDVDFIAGNSSIYITHPAGANKKVIEWIRPKNIADSPEEARLFPADFKRIHAGQRYMGESWLVTALATLVRRPHLLAKVFPPDQGFGENYAGIFHFRFWQYGDWLKLVIDDRLAVSDNVVMFLHSAETNEFWSCLLEKAYAKFIGSYAALSTTGITCCEALQDFTGGVTEKFEMNDPPANLLSFLLKASERKSMMFGTMKGDRNVENDVTPEGLIQNNPYTIMSVKSFSFPAPYAYGTIPMLRLSIPWGRKEEWNGAWGKASEEWKSVTLRMKEKLHLLLYADDEFWISFEDFKRFFTTIEICNLDPSELTEDDLRSGMEPWERQVFKGKWEIGFAAGGCGNFLETFGYNRQFRVKLEYPGEGDDYPTLMVAMMQENWRGQLRAGTGGLSIGFAIYHLADAERRRGKLAEKYFRHNAPVARTPSFTNMKEVTHRFHLPPGIYCIIPSTFQPHKEGKFLLRVFLEAPGRFVAIGQKHA